MSEDITVQVSSDLAPAITAIAQASTRIAALRAAKVAEVSGGAVETTPDQLAAITAAASAEIFADLRQQIRDVINVFVINLNERT